MDDPTTTSTEPNHHAHHPGFAGVSGVVAALSMAAGRSDVARLATRLVDLGRGDALVDVGCGPGAAARAAARQGATVTGVDPAPVMLRTARLLTRPGLSVRWLEGTAEALPLPDASTTVVWGLATVHHWADIDAAVAEAARVLRPGGRLLAVERRTDAGARGLASHGWQRTQAEAFGDRCRVAGFVDVAVTEEQAGREVVLAVLGRRA